MNETLAQLYREAGLEPAWERTPEARAPLRPRPRRAPIMQPAWERQPEAQPGFERETPAQALRNPGTLPILRRRSLQEVQQENELAELSANNSLGGVTGIANGRQQAEELGRGALEMTGAPAWARGINHVQRGQPGEAIPELLMGALNTTALATLPFGAGGRPPPRMGLHLAPQALPEATPPIRPPARLPGRATDGSVLPVRPPEPFRNSLRGGSDDLMDAARAPEAGAASGGRGGPIRVYHGSPHVFDEFDASRIGTGEGHQSFGHGLYFGEAEGTGQSYVTSVARRHFLYDGQSYDANNPRHVAAEAVRRHAGNIAEARADLWAQIHRLPKGPEKTALNRAQMEISNYLNHRQSLPRLTNPNGHLYEVDLNVRQDDLLDFDVPFSQQPLRVQRAFASLQGELGNAHMEDYYVLLAERLGSRQAASDALRAAGVRGIRYLDQGSRAAGEGSRNYVIFDAADARIVSRDGQPVRLPQSTPEAGAARGGRSADDMFRRARMSPENVTGAAEDLAWRARVEDWARRLDEGEYPREIARREGVPAWQIREAVDRLRGTPPRPRPPPPRRPPQ